MSTDEQVGNTSLDTQRQTTRDYVERRGWVLVDEYADEGVSGAKPLEERPALLKLMTAVRAGEVDAIVIVNYTRVGRSTRHFFALVGELDDMGIVVVSLAEQFDTSTPAGRLMRSIIASFAEHERDTIVERTSAGLRAVARGGHWPGGPPPFGYGLIKAGSNGERHAKLEIDPAEAAIVLRAFELATKHAVKRVAVLLNAEGLQPRGCSNGTGGRRWSHATASRLLRNEAYTGRFTYRPRQSDPIVFEIPAIITADLFALVQRRMAATSTGPRVASEPYLLARGLLFGPCGEPFHGVCRNDRDLRQYRCRGTHSADGDRRCDCRNVRADEMETVVWGAVSRVLSDPDRLYELADRWLADRIGSAGDDHERLALLERKVTELADAQARAAVDLLKAGLDASAIGVALAELGDQHARMAQARDEVARRVADAESAHVTRARLATLAAHARERLETMDAVEQRQVLEALQVRVVIEGWDLCPTCGGKGKVKGINAPCPECRSDKWRPRVRLEGVVSEAWVGDVPRRGSRRASSFLPTSSWWRL